MPYEVRGGIALHAGELWPFIQSMRESEEAAFGAHLSDYGSELKGYKLLDKKRFAWAAQDATLDDVARRKHALSFLNRGVRRESPTRVEFTAFGQGCMLMAQSVFRILRDHDATVFACAVPRGIGRRPPGSTELLRKDHVFLLERYFYFLEEKRDHGLLVMDQSEKKADRQFVSLLRRYFTLTNTGRYRTVWIVPAPLFVSSDMSYPIQAADVCIYCINWGFRMPARGMSAEGRPEIGQEYGPWLAQLQFKGQGYRDGRVYDTYGIVYVPDPYTAREA
ncbi:MAG: DUF3800 domain-containing protein [Candidatus Brocadiae bacterium]|nr:DUF3800 domain-containing protein [Candidatus Brocadiia bacterium]